jgi:TP901 family phage tail tape measure protein
LVKEMALAFTINGVLANSFGSSTKNAGKKLQDLQSRAKQVKMAMKNTEQAQNLLNKAFQAGGMSAETFQARMKSMQNSLKGYSKELGDLAEKQAKATSSALGGSDGKGKGISEHMGSLAGIASTIGVIASPFVTAVKTTMDFEAALSKVQSVTNATNEDMKKLSAQAESLGRNTAFSATEAAEAMTYLGMAGWNTQQIMSGMPGLLSLAAASGTDLATTADIVSDDLTAFGMKAEQAGHMADVMAVASSNANTNVEMMGMTFKYAGAIAGALGYRLEDVAVATGLMANAGIKAEQAGTSLRSIMNRLVAPPTAAAKALSHLGVSATNADGTVKPFTQTIKELRASMKGLSDAEKAEMASDIAGTEAMSGFLAVVNASEDDFNKLTNAVENADGAAEKMAAIKLNNLQGDLTLAKSALEDVAIQIGKALTPSLREFAQEAANTLSALGEWASQNQELITTVGKIAVAVAGAVLGVKAFQLGISLLVGGFNILKSPIMFVIEHFGIIKTVASTLFSVIQTGITLITPMIKGLFVLISSHPIIAIITAIIGALIYLWNTNEWFRNGVIDAWNAISAAAYESFGGAFETISTFMNEIQTCVSNAVDWVVQKWESLKSTLSAPIETAVSIMSKSADITANASGGIYGKGAFLTTFAENSPEAAIPIDGSRRAESLWRQTGAMMGLTRNDMSVNLSIPVTINGNADAGTVSQIQQSIDSAVERALQRIQHQRGRVSYA